jgi:hypothetical protein
MITCTIQLATVTLATGCRCPNAAHNGVSNGLCELSNSGTRQAMQQERVGQLIALLQTQQVVAIVMLPWQY